MLDWYLLVLLASLLVVLAETRDARYCLSIARHTLRCHHFVFTYIHFVHAHVLQYNFVTYLDKLSLNEKYTPYIYLLKYCIVKCVRIFRILLQCIVWYYLLLGLPAAQGRPYKKIHRPIEGGLKPLSKWRSKRFAICFVNF